MVLGVVIFLYEDQGTRVHAWFHLAVAALQRQKDCTAHYQKGLLKAHTSSDGENSF